MGYWGTSDPNDDLHGRFFILTPRVLAAKLAKGIIIRDISESFQFCKNMTVSKPIKVKLSLNKFKIAVLNKFVMC